MTGWTRRVLLGVFLGAGVAGGLALGRALDPAAGLTAQAAVPVPSAGLLALQDSFAEVAEFAGPSVVHITTQTGRDNDPWQTQGVGSGVIVSTEGHIITNHHVVDTGGERHQQLRVRFVDGKEYPATIVGSDSESDLALLKLKAPGDVRLTPITFADSEKVRVGDWCLAIGSPFGYNHSVTLGIVSAKHRRAQLAQPYQDFIQTDAAINPGNSGGALVNLKGELVGINAAIVSETRGSDGVGFAIASNLVKWVKDQLIKHGRVRRGYLGVRPVDFDSQLVDYYRQNYGIKSMDELLDELGLKAPRGVYVYTVEPESPAGKAGLKERDVIIEFNGKPVNGQSDMFFKVAEASPGTAVTVKVMRDKQERDLKIELTERPPVDLRRPRRR